MYLKLNFWNCDCWHFSNKRQKVTKRVSLTFPSQLAARLYPFILTQYYTVPDFKGIYVFQVSFITEFVTRVTWQVSHVEQEVLTLLEQPEFTPVLVGFVLLDLFCTSLFVLLYFFIWPLYCLFFFDLRLLITPLVT